MSAPLAPNSPVDLGRPFVIVATQRTGSTLLVRSLDASPHIFCAGEIFRDGPRIHHPEYGYPQVIAGSRVLARLADSLHQRKRVERHLTHLYRTARDGVRAVGFKAMVSQLEQFDELLPCLVRLGAIRFFLYRQDSFATALSHLKARETGIYHSDRTAKPEAPRAVTADMEEFRSLLARCKGHKESLQALHATYGGRLLTYEELTRDWDGTMSSIGHDLGIADLSVPRMLDKLGSSASTISVENEAELRRQFAAFDSA